MFSQDSRLESNVPDVAAKIMDGEAIIMNLANGNYYSLDGVGASVWELLDRGLAVSETIRAVSDRYGVDEGTVEREVTALVAELVEEELIRLRHEFVEASAEGFGGPVGYGTPALVKFTDMAELLALDPPMPGLGVGA
jgi:hypothetical protein